MPWMPRFYKKCRRAGCENYLGPKSRVALAYNDYCSLDCRPSMVTDRTWRILELFDEGKTAYEIAQIVDTTPQWANRVRQRNRNGIYDRARAKTGRDQST